MTIPYPCQDRPDTSDTGRIVGVLNPILPIAKINIILEAFTLLYGPGVTMSNGHGHRFEFRAGGNGTRCWCHDCEARDNTARYVLAGTPQPFNVGAGIIVCPDCGNKRCPRATNHHQECTGSNDPGQPGSIYQ